MVFYGRVRNQDGAGVPGALVMVFSVSGEEEKPLGHGYCDHDGWYALDLPRPEGTGPDKYTVRAAAGIGRAGDLPDSGLSWRGRAGWTGRRAVQVECRVINHSLLWFSAGDGGRNVSLEAVPETLSVQCVENGIYNMKMVSIIGRGYIQSGQERGEGAFSLTVGRFKDVPGDELLRFKITPDAPGASGLAFDTGGLRAGLD